ncbi:sorting nexin 2B-like [Lolium rigidum]|uniref:sorting nexin 2B-like n=1 Tax=Lolium rigidum TaxID=89674 RepID=UPI001F5CED2D|nr:sorting nexin 2B-like [Lolium rigidum]
MMSSSPLAGTGDGDMESLPLAAASDYASVASTFDPLLSSSPPSPPAPTAAAFPLSRASSSFVDPPSYADVAAASSPRAASSPATPRSARAAASSYAHIAVSDPETAAEPAATSLVSGSAPTYVSYLVTSAALPSGRRHAVRRRFRDFVTLADRLADAFRGHFVPPRPDKNTVESQVMQRDEFVAQRRAALERYLCRLAEHPAIGPSDELRVFLQAEGRMPLPTSTDVASRMLDGAARLPRQLLGEDAVAPPQDVVQPAKGGRDLLRIFKELKQSVVTDWGGVKPPLVEEDKEFLEKKQKVQDWEQQLNSASQQAEALVKAQQDMGDTMGALGLAFVKLTKFETEEAMYDSQRIRAVDSKRIATAAVKASRTCRDLNTQTVKYLDTLHEHLGIMLSVHTAFSDRASALLTVQTLMSDLASLQSRIEKLEAASSKVFGGDRTRLRKVEELRETIRATEDAKCCALREYERIKENNKVELSRLDRERREDFLEMLKGYVTSQAAYAEKIVDGWETVAEETSGYGRRSDNMTS